MSQTVRGVISRSKKQPVELVDIVIPDPGPGEVVVDIIACGVCHTDLTYREGGINDEYPFLLGHEASGTVEAVSLRVTRLRDVNGTVWYVRNGEIIRVGNMSQNWARTVLDVTVGYKEDLARVRPDLDGNEIMQILGLEPGPEVGKAWKYLKELRLERGELARDEAIAELKAWWEKEHA